MKRKRTRKKTEKIKGKRKAKTKKQGREVKDKKRIHGCYLFFF